VSQPDIQNLGQQEVEAWCESVGEPRFRATQILGWVHRKGAADFAAMTNLSKRLRAALASEFALERVVPSFVANATDGTQKLLFHLPADPTTRTKAAAIESVLIPQFERDGGARDRLTLCVSSQAGCAMACGFCATARLGLIRNLRPAEIVGQVRAGRDAAGDHAITNLVFMGMGEPLANYDHVRTALEILTADWGYAISPRRITVSTVGLAPDIPRFIAETRVLLAVSLTATTDAQRNRLMPINQRFPLADLMAACRAVPVARRERITFEYVMLDGENDTDADAHRLVQLLHGLRAKVNLIPFNPFPDAGFAPSPAARIARFQAYLRAHGLNTTVRESRGRDIQAACGQLAAARPAA
jgi:23S rRNA (adenine2503-C2)-methyltransferase